MDILEKKVEIYIKDNRIKERLWENVGDNQKFRIIYKNVIEWKLICY